MKPSWKEVEDFAKPLIEKHVRAKYKGVPDFEKDEMIQEAWVGVFTCFNKLNGEGNWKAYMTTRIKGAALDYYKGGKGLLGGGKKKEDQNNNPKQYSFRIEVLKDDMVPEDALGILGAFDKFDDNENEIKWDLVARMAARDDMVLILAKFILGYRPTELAENAAYSRERIHQKMSLLADKLNDPIQRKDKWVRQIIYAFGLCDMYDLPKEDMGWGWEYEPVDLWGDVFIESKAFSPQLELFA